MENIMDCIQVLSSAVKATSMPSIFLIEPHTMWSMSLLTHLQYGLQVPTSHTYYYDANLLVFLNIALISGRQGSARCDLCI
jgi:hypothetical protein